MRTAWLEHAISAWKADYLPINIIPAIYSNILQKITEAVSSIKIVKLTKLIVFSRRGYDKKSKESIVVKYLNKKNIVYVNNKLIDVSSSKIKKNYLKYF